MDEVLDIATGLSLTLEHLLCGMVTYVRSRSTPSNETRFIDNVRNDKCNVLGTLIILEPVPTGYSGCSLLNVKRSQFSILYCLAMEINYEPPQEHHDLATIRRGHLLHRLLVY